MFDIGAEELLVIVVVAILVIGPKDMPTALRAAGRWIGKMRRMSGHFRSGLDAMIREAEMEDMEKKWKAQNEKIMRQYPEGGPTEMEPTGAFPPAKGDAAPVPPALSGPETAPKADAPADAASPQASSAEARVAPPSPVADDAKKAD
ncbi:Sec-independent protein translocase protein TatB [Alteraurantiacibacter aestuarii]|uniref:Sec-independent protein translocase protein TatB n=1 Tax=Alteraurantiacibacter aestuarii TaxID=650004 RepID=A0A844ZPF9_9SPHN|nr:Sec-independent protein translocase protein TatB [Alteraurantiacibacter aestuarii]MXO88920.1 twin-arginine translocase subunit TatB [Alteraurantiacibacter aestuarii]